MKQHYYFTCTVNICWFEAAFILLLNNKKLTKNGQLLVKPYAKRTTFLFAQR